MQDNDLIGIYEIAKISGVSPAAVANWRKRYSNFPRPVAELRSGPIFQQRQILYWIRKKEGSMAKVIALFNNKGGVGKTTTIWNLATALAEQRKKVLVIDFDPQCNLSIAVLGETEFAKCLTSSKELPYGQTIKAFVLPYIQQNSLAKAYTRKPTKVNSDLFNQSFDIVPGDFWLNHFSDILNVGTEVIGGAGLYRFLTPSALIKAVEEENNIQYDFALIDLPPSFNTLVRAALYSSDYFIVPCTPDLFSAYCVGLIGQVLPKFIADWEQGKSRYLESNAYDEIIPKKGQPKFGGWVFNGFDTRKKLHSKQIVKTGADEAQFNQVKKSIQEQLIPKLKNEIKSYEAVPDFINIDPVASIEDLNVMAPDSILQNIPIPYLAKTGPTSYYGKSPQKEKIRKGSWTKGQKELMNKMATQYEQLAKLIIEKF